MENKTLNYFIKILIFYLIILFLDINKLFYFEKNS